MDWRGLLDIWNQHFYIWSGYVCLILLFFDYIKDISVIFFFKVKMKEICTFLLSIDSFSSESGFFALLSDMLGGSEWYIAHLPTPSKHKVDTQWCNSIMKMKRTHRFAKNKSPQNVKCIINGHVRGPRCDLFFISNPHSSTE